MSTRCFKREHRAFRTGASGITNGCMLPQVPEPMISWNSSSESCRWKCDGKPARSRRTSAFSAKENTFLLHSAGHGEGQNMRTYSHTSLCCGSWFSSLKSCSLFFQKPVTDQCNAAAVWGFLGFQSLPLMITIPGHILLSHLMVV